MFSNLFPGDKENVDEKPTECNIVHEEMKSEEESKENIVNLETLKDPQQTEVVKEEIKVESEVQVVADNKCAVLTCTVM